MKRLSQVAEGSMAFGRSESFRLASRALTSGLVAALLVGCFGKKEGPSPGGRDELTARGLALASDISNGGLTTTGLWNNGLWAEGTETNPLWASGVWQSGSWNNGVLSGGTWTGGVWANGIWTSGLWANAVWSSGGAGGVLRSSAYTRQLLQYVYACAMPPATYDTTLDPNNGTLACSSPDGGGGGSACPEGYTCSAQGSCVVPLAGAVGVGVNADGSTWGGSGTCDESCQRWVSACVLARTNTYGVHADLSMRAPAVAPPGHELQLSKIQAALTTTVPEANGYVLREGAYYGNLFAISPGAGPTPVGSGPSTPRILQNPSFFACAGPASSIPEMAKRFGSSQGDQGVVGVPGVCVTTAAETGVCDGMDASGSIDGCNTEAGGTGTHYDEVITVYLRQPITVCGNAVCERGEEAAGSPGYCPTDCHPGTWAKDLPFIGDIRTTGDTPTVASPFRAGRFPPGDYPERMMSTVGSDGSIVLAGNSRGDVDVGGGTLPASGGAGVLAKYGPSGAYLWGARFGDVYSGSGFPYQVLGAAVSPTSGDVSVLGEDNAGQLWITTFDGAAGIQIGSSTVIATNADNFGVGAPVGQRTIAADGEGNLVVGLYATDRYSGVATPFTIGTQSFSCPGGSALVGPCLAVAKVAPQTVTSPNATVAWAQELPWAGWGFSLAIDPSSDDIVMAESPNLLKICSNGAFADPCPSGAGAFVNLAVVDQIDSVAIDGAGNIYGTGLVNSLPIVEKFNSNGLLEWRAKQPIVVSGPMPNPSGLWELTGIDTAVDPSGNVISASFGNIALDGGVNFGFGTLPTYATDSVFVSAYEPTAGQLLWVKQIPIVGWSMLLGTAVDASGRVVISGNFTGSMLADGFPLVTAVPESNGAANGYTTTPGIVDSYLTSFTIPGPDTTAPLIGSGYDGNGALLNTVSQHIVTPAVDSTGAQVFFSPPTAVDNGMAGVSVVCSPAPNSVFPIGTTTVSCTATDARGNASSVTFPVSVFGTLGPVFNAPPDVEV